MIRLSKTFRFRKLILLGLLLATQGPSSAQETWWQIPTQVINFGEMIGAPPSAQPDTIKGFLISRLITYGEYKQYLEAVRKDSG